MGNKRNTPDSKRLLLELEGQIVKLRAMWNSGIVPVENINNALVDTRRLARTLSRCKIFDYVDGQRLMDMLSFVAELEIHMMRLTDRLNEQTASHKTT